MSKSRDQTNKTILNTLQKKKIALFVSAPKINDIAEYLLGPADKELLCHFVDIFMIYDKTEQSSSEAIEQIYKTFSDYPLHIYQTPYDRGYGGIQKLGYLYCLKNKYDMVIFFQANGHYPPEILDHMLETYEDSYDAVFGSRLMLKENLHNGSMNLYRWIGNKTFVFINNKLLKSRISDFFSGCRAYRIDSLKKIPFDLNSDGFHFDTEIIIQALAMNWKIKEIPITLSSRKSNWSFPHIRVALQSLKTSLIYQLNYMGLFYSRNFDFGLFDTENYQFKKSSNSHHQYIVNHNDFTAAKTCIELGANQGILSSHIALKVKQHTAVDISRPDKAGKSKTSAIDLNTQFSTEIPVQNYDICIALDTIEHMDSPERFLTETFQILKPGGKLFISTANIGYIITRISLFFGLFHYGKRGILDRTHKRLFTVKTFIHLLTQFGFQVETTVGFPPPIVDLISKKPFFALLEKAHFKLSNLFPKLWAYNFLIIATKTDSIDEILNRTIK